MSQRLKAITAAVVVSLSIIFGSQVFSKSENRYWAVTVHDHKLLNDLREYSYSYISKARVQIVEFKSGYSIENIPQDIASKLRPFDPDSLVAFDDNYRSNSLSRLFRTFTADNAIAEVLENISAESFFERVKFVTSFGPRTNDQSIGAFIKAFQDMGYETKHNFNIEAWKKGTKDPSKYVIVMGHMDTVARTMGADDNASGAAGVMEIAQALKDYESDYSILFILTEDEEIGLVGAEKYVKELKNNGTKNDVLFVVNMDMIAYNKNNVVDLETEDQFEDLAKWMAKLTEEYTTLTPNIVLDTWGSDHIPFIQANIPAILTIEHWNTHTPCWHKTCDTLDTINANFAAEILKLNLAATIIKAGVKVD